MAIANSRTLIAISQISWDMQEEYHVLKVKEVSGTVQPSATISIPQRRKPIRQINSSSMKIKLGE